ncbi:hypothetical protein SLA2020_321870 [Shorea laevis]
MAEEDRVTLYGLWASPYVKRVELALKLKGIPFEYVEEDLKNKSPQLLKYNPVYKKIPVLVHNGNPISESLVIVEYIEETWKNSSPHLLPQTPYERARVRFWSSFVDQQMYQALFTVAKTEGEKQEKAIKELSEKLQLLEEGMKEFFLDENAATDTTNVGLLDIVFLPLFGPHKAQVEALGIKVIDPVKTPVIFSRVEALSQLPLVKELTPPHEKSVAFIKFVRENALKASSA